MIKQWSRLDRRTASPRTRPSFRCGTESMWRLAPIIVLGGWSLHARAAGRLVSTVASHHRNKEAQYNERNWGLGFERDFTENARLIGGACIGTATTGRASAPAGLHADLLGEPCADRCAGRGGQRI